MRDLYILPLTFNVRFDEVLESDSKVSVPFKIPLPISFLSKEQLEEVKNRALYLIIQKGLEVEISTVALRIDRFEFEKKKVLVKE